MAFIADTLLQLLAGVPMTLELTAISVSAGAILAGVLALLTRLGGPASWIARGYIFVFRGSPLLVQIFLIYYGLGQFPAVRQSLFWPFLRQPWWCALLALSLNTAAYGAEVIRGGLLAVPKGQIEAGRVCGMSTFTLYRRVILPLALRQALPAYGNEVIIMVKSTSLASVITLMEVTGIAKGIISETFRALPVFACAAAIYLAINFTIAGAVRLLERRLGVAS
ncbi:ABC transporter permease [Acidisphaera sp. L21]|uniref:ABC transporter permease n=1 Tax=Acidisphaera sp. L21 TaxID=1641851 RepID=UPI00131D029A|nr:ABC transporter permease [Acidisphaera sp. L21]